MALAKLNHNYLDPLKVSNENIDGTLGVNTLNVSSTFTAPTIIGSTLSISSISASSTINAVGSISTSGQFIGSGAGLTSIPNNALVNSSVTINGTSVSLGGSISIIALPAQSAGTAGYFLQSNGTSASWVQLGLATPTVPGTVYGKVSANGYDTFIGQYAGVNATSIYNINTGVGNYALSGLTYGMRNTAIGQSSLQQMTGNSNVDQVNNNTGVGALSGFGLLYGSNNTMLGTQTGYNSFQGSNNLLIGYNANTSSSSVSNEITLGDSNITAFRIPGLGVNFTRTSNLIQSQATTQVPLSIQGIAGQSGYLQTWLNYTGTAVGSIDNSGNLIAAGDITTNSDSRLKDNIEPITDALTIVNQITGVTYSLIDDDKKIRHVGLIAQDVEAVMPEAVLENEDGIKSVAYGNLVGLLVEAIKELRAEVTELRGMIDGI
jgi:Chaperone of endosialidase